MPALEKLLAVVDGEWVFEDLVYRFYHQSFKVYGIQSSTNQVVEALRALLPDVPLDNRFRRSSRKAPASRSRWGTTNVGWR